MRQRLLPQIGSLLLIGAVFTLPGFSQDAGVRGPVLGFIPDARNESIRPILGIPGSSLLGHPLSLDVPIRIAAVSPSQDEALAVLDTNPQVVSHLRFGAATYERADLADVNAGADIIGFSPTGTAAIVYDHETRLLQSLLMKPSPEIVFQFDASAMRGSLKAMAATDSGRFAVIQFTVGGDSETWVVDSQNDGVLIPIRHTAEFTFVPRSDEFLIVNAETGQLSRVSSLDTMRSEGLRVIPAHTAAEFSGLRSLAISQDGARIFGVTESGTALVMDAATGHVLSLPCHCTASGLYPLKGRSVFRLSSPEDGPIAILDAGAAAVRVVLIPAEVIP